MGHAAKQMIKHMQGSDQELSLRIRIPRMLSPKRSLCLSGVTVKHFQSST